MDVAPELLTTAPFKSTSNHILLLKRRYRGEVLPPARVAVQRRQTLGQGQCLNQELHACCQNCPNVLICPQHNERFLRETPGNRLTEEQQVCFSHLVLTPRYVLVRLNFRDTSPRLFEAPRSLPPNDICQQLSMQRLEYISSEESWLFHLFISYDSGQLLKTQK